MKQSSPLLLLLLTFFFFQASPGFASENFSKPKTIAVYNIDSIMILMPAYADAVKQYNSFKSEINENDSAMKLAFQKKLLDFYCDSSKFSPLVRQYERMEIKSLEARINEFHEDASLALEDKKEALLLPLKKEAEAAAAELGKQNSYLAVICMRGYVQRLPFTDSYPDFASFTEPLLVSTNRSQPLSFYDPEIKTVNITKAVALKLGINM